uniref:CARD domain-containing protein n=1 Tax=Podarcis muralis TaxID=64176 RepID=A0A670JHF8_PODMU
MQKNPVTMKPLKIGSRFFVQKLDDVTIYPKELKLNYLNADMKQQYIELCAQHMQDELELNLINKKDELVWKACVRHDELTSSVLPPAQEDLTPSVFHSVQDAPPSSSSDCHFIEQYREQLIQRTTNVAAVLDMLHGQILDEEQYQKISSRETNQEKMRELYTLVPGWNHYCKDQLYKALKAKNRFLIADLEWS